MENITPFSDIVDVSLLILSAVIALIYINNYYFCHAVTLIGVILLILSIFLGEILFDCNPISNTGIYDLYKAEKSCLPTRVLPIFLGSVGAIFAAITGYIKVTAIYGLKKVKKNI